MNYSSHVSIANQINTSSPRNSSSMVFDTTNYSIILFENMRLYNSNNYCYGTSTVTIKANNNTILDTLSITRYGSHDTGILQREFNVDDFEYITVTTTFEPYAYEIDVFSIGKIVVK